MKLLEKNKIIVIVLLLLAIAPYVYISFFAHPIADDFTYAYKGKQGNLFSTLLGEYNTWNGRYMSNIFVLINPIVYDSFIGYQLAPIVLIFLTIFSVFFFIRTLTNNVFKTYTNIVLASLFSLLFLHQMPIISEGIYWYTAAVTYQLGIIFLLYFIGFIILFLRNKIVLKSKILHIGIIFFYLVATIGSNEILMIAVFLLSAGMYLISRIIKAPNNTLLFVLIASLLLSLLVYFAPGNSVRESFFPDNHKFIHSVVSSLAQCVRFFSNWIASASLILMSILYYAIHKKLSAEVEIFKKSFYLTPLLSIALVIFVIFIGAFLPYWSTGIMGQHRSMNVSYFLFLIVWFINLTVFYNRGFLHFDIKHTNTIKALFILIWFSLVFSKNGFDVLFDIQKGDHILYNKQMTERYTIVEQSTDTIYFKPIVNKPKTLFVLDITDNPENWQNTGYAIFFDKPEIPVVLKE